MKSKGSEKVQDPKPANGGAPRTKGMEVRLERLAGQADGCRVSSFLSTRSLKFLCPGGGGGGGGVQEELSSPSPTVWSHKVTVFLP